MDRDIVERLREGTGPIKPNLIDDAADTIERLRARVGQLEADASALAAERDEARRAYCRGWTDFCPNPKHANLSLEKAAKLVAESFGWDCFKEDGK